MEGANRENNEESESPNENGQKNDENVENTQQESSDNEVESSNAEEEVEEENHGGESSVKRGSTSNKESVRKKLKTNGSISEEKEDGSESQNEDVQIISDEPSGMESSCSSFTVGSDEPGPSDLLCRLREPNIFDSTNSIRVALRKKTNLNIATEKMSTDGSEGDDEDELGGNGNFTDDGIRVLYATGNGSEEFYPIPKDSPTTGELQSKLSDIDISRPQNDAGQSANSEDLASDNHLYYAINQTVKLEEFAASVARFMRFSGKFSISDAPKIAKFTHSTSKGLYGDDKGFIWHLSENITPQRASAYKTEGYVITHNGKCSSKCPYWCSSCRICSHEYSCSCSADAKNLMWCHHLHAAVLYGIYRFEGPTFAIFFTRKGSHYQGMIRFNIKRDVREEKPWILKIRDVLNGNARLEKFHKPKRNYSNCRVCSPLQRCPLCQICRHYYGCSCDAYAINKVLCEHCHFAHKYFQSKESEQSNDSEENGENGDKNDEGDKDKDDEPKDKVDISPGDDCGGTAK